MAYQNRKAMKEGNSESREKFQMDIFAEGALDKARMDLENLHILNNPERQYMRLLKLSTLKIFMLSFKNRSY